jgi:triphosphatase
MPTECELKLVAPRESLIRLADAAPIESRASGPARSEELISVYYDTPDGLLAGRGLALRVRRVHGRHVQTLKRGGGVTRGEWETSLDGADPEPDLLFSMAGEDDLIGLPRGKLRAVLSSKIERRLREIRLNGRGVEHRIEVALDLGELEVAARRAPVAELELELLEGDPSALYSLALELADQEPLRVETLSKAARGDLLRTGAAPDWRKAGKIELDPAGSVGDAMGRIFQHCYDHWQDNQAAAIDGRDSEGVHQVRVALRRLRSAFSLFKAALPAEATGAFKDAARTVVKSLGDARDLDVLHEDLVLPLRRRRADDPALESLAARLDAARRDAYAGQVGPGLSSEAYTRFQLTFGGWVAQAGWRGGAAEEVRAVQDTPILDFAQPLLDQRFKSVRKHGRHFARLSAAERHQLRIRIKKLRYALDFCRSLFPGKLVKEMLGTLSGLQDRLGAANDLAVAGERLDMLAAEARGSEARRLAHATGFVLGWHGAAAAAGERALASQWKRFKGERPAWRGD